MNVCVLVIDRAKKDAAESCLRLEAEHNLKVKAYLLVSEEFKKSPAYKGDEADGYFEEVTVDFSDLQKLNQAVEKLTHGYDKVLIHCIIEAAMGDCAKVIELAPDTFSQTPKSLEISSEKSKMRQSFTENFPEITPKFTSIDSASEVAESLIENFNFPLIVKPNGLTSSFLVNKCHDLRELQHNTQNAFAELEKIYDREHGVGKKSVVIEEFIEGVMYSVDAYVLKDAKTMFFMPPVRVITAHDVGLEGFYGFERRTEHNLSAQDIDEANECTRKAILSVGLMSSTAHVELYHTKDGWKVIELGPRIGGYRQELYKLAYGLESFYNDFLIHLDIEPDTKPKKHEFASAINIYPEREGSIVRIDGLEEAKKLDSVVSIKTHAAVNAEARFAINGGKYVVDAILHNRNASNLLDDTKKVRDLIKITVK